MLKFFKLPLRKSGARKKVTPPETSGVSVQEWLPFSDIHGGVIHRKDGSVVAVLRVQPFNLALKSANEKKRIISAVHEALNGQQEQFQILSLARPVDLDAYLCKLEDMTREITENSRRRRLLQNYLRYVASLVASGEALERRYYILLPQQVGKQAREEVLQRAHELAMDLERAGLKVNVCDDQEIVDLLFCFTHPVQAAFERAPSIAFNIVTQVEY